MNGELDNYLNLCYNYNHIAQLVSLNKSLVKLREVLYMSNNTDMRSEGMNSYILSNHTKYNKSCFLALKYSDIRFNNDINLNAI